MGGSFSLLLLSLCVVSACGPVAARSPCGCRFGLESLVDPRLHVTSHKVKTMYYVALSIKCQFANSSCVCRDMDSVLYLCYICADLNEHYSLASAANQIWMCNNCWILVPHLRVELLDDTFYRHNTETLRYSMFLTLLLFLSSVSDVCLRVYQPDRCCLQFIVWRKNRVYQQYIVCPNPFFPPKILLY